MKLRTSLAVATAALTLGALAPAQAAPTLLFEASATQIAIGGSTVVDVKITGLAPQALSNYDVNLVWNAGVLNWTVGVQNYFDFFGADFDAAFGEPNGDPMTQGDAGLWLASYETEADLLAAQAGRDPFTLFSFAFEGMADGATFLTLGSDPDFDRLFVDGAGNAMNVAIGGVCIAVGTGTCDNQVPEPAGYALALTALGVAGLARRRAKAKTAA